AVGLLHRQILRLNPDQPAVTRMHAELAVPGPQLGRGLHAFPDHPVNVVRMDHRQHPVGVSQRFGGRDAEDALHPRTDVTETEYIRRTALELVQKARQQVGELVERVGDFSGSGHWRTRWILEYLLSPVRRPPDP